LADPVVEVSRAGRVEAVARADGVVVDVTGRIVAWLGRPYREAYFGAAAHPLRATLLLTTGAVDRFGLDGHDLALAAGAGADGAAHVEGVTRLLARVGASAAQLRCGEGAEGSHHPCAGQHAAMMAVAAALGEAPDRYWEAAHPAEVRAREVVALFLGMKAGTLVGAAGACGLWTPYVPLARMAWAYARLCAGRGLPDGDAAAGMVVAEALRTHPDDALAPDALARRVGVASGSRAVCVTGPRGLFCAALPEKGYGVALKMEDGEATVLGAAAAAVLAMLPAFPEPVRQDLARLAVDAADSMEAGQVMPVVELQWGQVTA
jgi:L-asparaginase II